MPTAKRSRPVHLRDQFRRVSCRLTGGRVFAVCGAIVRERDTTLAGWKVTCPECNPPTRRKVRLKPRPGAPAAPTKDLETA